MSTSLRPLTAGDAPTIHSLIRAAEIHDGAPIITSLEEVEDYFEEPDFDPETMGCLAVDGDEAVGWGRILHSPSGVRLERAHLEGCVRPEHRRNGVGRAILAWQLERGRELLAGYDHDLPRYLRTMQYEWVADAIGLYERAGMRPVRWFEELRRPLDPLPSPQQTPGVQIVPWDPRLAEPVRQVKNEAFADHWGSTPSSARVWRSWLEEHVVRLDLSFVALHEGEPIGYSINEHYPQDEELTGRRDGWIGNLGVLRNWRRRGVASILIQHSLHGFAGAGFTHAMIGVDSDNPSGAAGLYRALGFEPVIRSVTHELQVG